MPPWFESGLRRSADYDRRSAIAFHRGVAHPQLLRMLVWCSHAADTPVWLALTFALPLLDAERGVAVARLMLAVGVANLLVYWGIKQGTRRSRPFAQCDDIRACIQVPDTFSFPSGHALHAVSFALLLSFHYEAWSAPLWGFAILVAVSRVVLGVHYPSDVVAGALIGLMTASLALMLGG